MRIGVDCDGVLADFNTAFVAYMVKVTGIDLFPARPFEPTTWDYPQFYGYSNQQTSDVWDVIKLDPIFWMRIPVYPDTRESLESLWNRSDGGDDIYFVTNRMGNRAKAQTEVWIDMESPFRNNPTVLLTADKAGAATLLKLDAFIDDKWENCAAVSTVANCQTFMLDRPWNQRPTPEGVTRVVSVSEMLDRL
jgi:uncharacterized HAD superfamily protein